MSVGADQEHISALGCERFPVGGGRRAESVHDDELLDALPPVDDATRRRSKRSGRSRRSRRSGGRVVWVEIAVDRRQQVVVVADSKCLPVVHALVTTTTTAHV